ncbi:MAG TPA: glycosyltransferase family 4 protein [Intrasporangium sp.]|uniref:glycosyltransferase family 4 protein n=1 Tax=Intrasporangium sp. TaxID=1925024 RepID=UPI002D76FDC8|nr:glycosyltransferase family 4 protein [Intrasporangium sp.]HET7399833.1 glycosyltransferase family 4 protein [Intrasporangium sp.]
MAEPGQPAAVRRFAGRALRVARNLRLLAGVAARHAQDDPALLAVQVMRRLPGRARHPLSRCLQRLGGRGPSAARALGDFLADRPADARRALEALAATGSRATRLTTEVAVQLGLEAPAGAPPPVLARSRWNRGDLSGAIAALDAGARADRNQRDRLASLRTAMTVGYRVARPERAIAPKRATAPRPPAPRRPRASLRVLHLLTNSLPRTQSGYSLRSHAILRAQQASGLAVEAVTTLGYPVTVGLPLAREVDVVEGIRYRRLLPARLASTPTARLEQAVAALLRVVECFQPDVLHTTTHFPNALVTSAVAGETGLPWVYEVRGQLEKTWQASRPAAERQAAARSERFLLSRAKETEMALAADHVVVLSEALRADFEARGVPADHITVVPNAVDSALLRDVCPPAVARRDLALDPGGFWVGSVSSLVGYEGLDVLLDAVAVLRRRGLDVRCAIVGDGVARPELVRRADLLGLGGAAVLPGRVPRTEAPRWHRALDVFAVPRRDLEVCRTVTPLKPIEAMACGRPVVASDLPALAEIVAAPRSGLLFPPEDPVALADTVQLLLEDPALRDELGRGGVDFAATRTWDAMAARYRTIYDALTARR